MAFKNLISNQPTSVRLDKKGNPINIYRGGIRDTNKYAKKTPHERHNEKQLGG